jgi:2-dehydro-3-deoxyphosphogluconate aldolase/(4S)-4-hydroxy-2-oxoglutarate aldolase
VTDPSARPALPNGLLAGGVVGIARRLTADTAPQVADALVDGGVLAFEIRECQGPFPDIPLAPSGGVTPDTAADFIRAGAVRVGVGSWLIGDAEPAGVTARARRIVDAVAAARADVAR